jgi:hypothetical protein
MSAINMYVVHTQDTYSVQCMCTQCSEFNNALYLVLSEHHSFLSCYYNQTCFSRQSQWIGFQGHTGIGIDSAATGAACCRS